MLWDLIRDWFVMHIWGGLTSESAVYEAFIGEVSNEDTTYANVYTNTFQIKIGQFLNGGDDVFYNYISLGDWLSTISTIIVLIALCFFFFLMVRWLFRLTAGLIQGRG